MGRNATELESAGSQLMDPRHVAARVCVCVSMYVYWLLLKLANEGM